MNARRVGTVAGAGLLTVLLVAGCSPAATSTGPSQERPEKVDLTVALWGGADRADLYQQVIDNFAEGEEGVTATMEFADQSPYFERLTTSAASQNLPDLFWLTETHFGRYAEAGALLDLAPYIGENIDADAIGENWLRYGEFDDGIYAIPSNFNGQGVLVDQNVLDAAGLEYDVESWDDLAELARELARPGEGYYGVTDPTVGQTQRAFEVWVRQHDQEVYGEKGGVGFDRDTLIAWWEYWADLRDDGIIPTPDVQIESESQGLTNDLLVTGKAAIRLSSATHLTAAGTLRDGGLTLHGYPEIEGAAEDWRFYTALLLAAAANTPAPGVAADLINEIVNAPEAAAITQISMGTPTSSAVSESVLPLLSEGDRTVVEYLNEQLEFPTRPSPIVPETSQQFTAELARYSQEVAYGRLSPAEAADKLLAEADRILG
ncbi:ABC transporter substrate-binding protein [Microbacterium saperdae]